MKKKQPKKKPGHKSKPAKKKASTTRASKREYRLALGESVRHRFDMTDSAKGPAPILAAGGIVLRGTSRPRIAVVRMRREKAWVLPKGKLMPREHPRDAAKREVVEETGHEVSVHEFLGSMSYAVEGKVKIVQFWLMRAMSPQVHELMDDVKAVKWLPLKDAVKTLTRPHEKVFLTHVGPIALGHVRKAARKNDRKTAHKKSTASRNGSSRRTAVPTVSASPVEHVIAMDYQTARPNAFVKALGSWIGRVAHGSARRVG
jgi:8-oxo-dGTP pyrophosphatase MutT (NUDIX family)